MLYFFNVDDDLNHQASDLHTFEEGYLTVAKTKAAINKSPRTAKGKSAGEQEVTVCRRRADQRDKKTTERSDSADANQNEEVPEEGFELTDSESQDAVQEPSERRKVQRRRQIDPTTCERDYTDDEIQFMHALDAYKRSSGRMFPTCSEILEVVRGLGYERFDRHDVAEDLVTDPVSEDSSDNLEEPSGDLEFVTSGE